MAGVHFGPMRVVDAAVRTLVMKNTGKYDVAYRFTISSSAVSDLVTITSMEGTMQPGKEAPVTVRRSALSGRIG